LIIFIIAIDATLLILHFHFILIFAISFIILRHYFISFFAADCFHAPL